METESRGSDAFTRLLKQKIQHQAGEIIALNSQLADLRLVEELRRSLIDAAAVGVIAAPLAHSRLLELIVQTSMRVVAAEAGSLFLLDEAAQELSFEVALGPHASAVRQLRVPLGHGIAGLVAYTGQAIIVADAGRDPRQASDIARAIGYTPRSILCVPLLHGDHVIGVLELLDKIGDQSFAPADMETSTLFAEQAAVAIEQSVAIRNISGLLSAVLMPVIGRAEERILADNAALLAKQLEKTAQFQRTLELAGLVREIGGSGESETRLCDSILRAFLEFLRSKRASSFDNLGT